MFIRRALLVGLLCAGVLLPALAAPPPNSKPSITQGKVVFDKNSCNVCHVNGGNTIDKNKPIKGAAFVKRFPTDAALESLIRQGVKATSMPAFGKDKINDTAMKDLIAYIRSLTPVSCK